ncbi:MAG: trypsin-like peptidase domain-containing protein [Mariniblastus sp.]|nr:trypsin-like peptidase domain-containing protein [Mariniblastus sp.]
MLDFNRLIACFLLCCTGWGFLPADVSLGQESTVQTDAKTDKVDTDFLFSGEAPKTIEQLRQMETRFAEVSERVKAATVNIQMSQSQGSGVVVSSDGYILTAAHVIGDPNQSAKITFLNDLDEDGKPKVVFARAETLGIDRGIDSGMLKIVEKKGEENDFPYIDIAISAELNEGQWVMAVGHPGGLDKARGMVTRIGRILSASSRVIRTDCTLVGGDSGGPLIDMNGDLIGIHSRIGSELVDNLHVPADVYSENWDSLAKALILDGTPSLGINVVDDTNVIKEVSEGRAADKAGLKVGDIILEIDSIDVTDKASLGKAIKELNLKPNSKIEIVVLREAKEKELELKVGEKGKS